VVPEFGSAMLAHTRHERKTAIQGEEALGMRFRKRVRFWTLNTLEDLNPESYQAQRVPSLTCFRHQERDGWEGTWNSILAIFGSYNFARGRKPA